MTPREGRATVELPAPVTCQPWCRDGDGHPDADNIEDQACLGVERHVSLTIEQAAGQADDYLVVEADQDYAGALPLIRLGRGDQLGVHLRPSEAALLAKALSDAVAEVEMSRECRTWE